MKEMLLYADMVLWFITGGSAVVAAFWRGKRRGFEECEKIYRKLLDEMMKNLHEQMQASLTDLGMIQIPADQIPEAIRERIEEVRNQTNLTKH